MRQKHSRRIDTLSEVNPIGTIILWNVETTPGQVNTTDFFQVMGYGYQASIKQAQREKPAKGGGSLTPYDIPIYGSTPRLVLGVSLGKVDSLQKLVEQDNYFTIWLRNEQDNLHSYFTGCKVERIEIAKEGYIGHVNTTITVVPTTGQKGAPAGVRVDDVKELDDVQMVLQIDGVEFKGYTSCKTWLQNKLAVRYNVTDGTIRSITRVGTPILGFSYGNILNIETAYDEFDSILAKSKFAFTTNIVVNDFVNPAYWSMTFLNSRLTAFDSNQINATPPKFNKKGEEVRHPVVKKSIAGTGQSVTFSSEIPNIQFTAPTIYDNFEAGNLYVLADGATSPNTKWRSVTSASGVHGTEEDKRSGSWVFFEIPAIAADISEDFTSLVVSTKTFNYGTASANMKTTNQLRDTADRSDNEVAWFYAKYVDTDHNYYVYITKNGWVLGKRDNPPGDSTVDYQRVLAKGDTPVMKLGAFNSVAVHLNDTTETGIYQVVLDIDNIQVADVTDDGNIVDEIGVVNRTTTKLAGVGSVGMSAKDANVSFDNVDILGVNYTTVPPPAPAETLFTKTFKIGVVLAKEKAKRFSIDSILDSIKKLKTFTMDVISVKQRTRTFTLDAIIAGEIGTRAFTLGSILTKARSKNFSLDAILNVSIAVKNFSIGAITAKAFSKSFTLGAILNHSIVTKTFALGAILKKTNTKTFKLDAIIDYPPIASYSIVTVGDFGVNQNAQDVLDTVRTLNPNQFIALGDYAYESSPTEDDWFNISTDLEPKMKVIIGNHDSHINSPDVGEAAKLQRLIDRYGLPASPNIYWSYDIPGTGIHVLVTTIGQQGIGYDLKVPYNVGSPQYNFIVADLAAASTNPAIKWIIVANHKPFYTRLSKGVGQVQDPMRLIYHPIFDQYKVDLVIQGHNHDYQRTYPIKYNASEGAEQNPIIVTTEPKNYTNVDGRIFMLAGTGGIFFHAWTGATMPFNAIEFNDKWGVFKIELLNGGKTLSCKWMQSKSLTVYDQFNITKS